MMDFDHPMLKKWIPSSIHISEEKYKSRLTVCKKCDRDHLKYMCSDGFYKNQQYYKFKIETDIFFNVYYWLKTDSLRNKYAYSDSVYSLCGYFECQESDLLNKAKEIGISQLVNLATYHSLWLHYFHHQMYSLDGNLMEEWDSMLQPKHVHAKNEINLLIYLLLSSPERKTLMQEIRDFTMCPPSEPGSICGYEYKNAKQKWEDRFKT